MCGIIAGFNKANDVTNDIIEQFQDQRSRGTEGFGIFLINEDRSFEIKRATSEIMACVDLRLSKSKMALFHHRNPTSSTNKTNQTHPLLISDKRFDYDYYFMHNGMSRNTDDLYKKHTELEYKYSSYDKIDKDTFQYNDSESLGVEIVRVIEGEKTDVGSFGPAAFFMVQVDKKTKKVVKIFFGRNNSNPMKIHQSGGQIFLSSTGKGAEVEADFLYSFNPFAKKYKVSKTKLIAEPFEPITKTKWKDHKEEKEDTEINSSSWEDQNDLPIENDKLGEIMEEANDILADFIEELHMGHENPFEVDHRDTLRQLNIVLKEAVQVAQDNYVDESYLQDEVSDRYNKMYAK